MRTIVYSGTVPSSRPSDAWRGVHPTVGGRTEKKTSKKEACLYFIFFTPRRGARRGPSPSRTPRRSNPFSTMFRLCYEVARDVLEECWHSRRALHFGFSWYRPSRTMYLGCFGSGRVHRETLALTFYVSQLKKNYWQARERTGGVCRDSVINRLVAVELVVLHHVPDIVRVKPNASVDRKGEQRVVDVLHDGAFKGGV